MKRYGLSTAYIGSGEFVGDVVREPDGDWVQFDDTNRTRRRLLAKLLRRREVVIGQNIWARSGTPHGDDQDDWDRCAYRRMEWCDRVAARLEKHDPEAERNRWSARAERLEASLAADAAK